MTFIRWAIASQLLAQDRRYWQSFVRHRLRVVWSRTRTSTHKIETDKCQVTWKWPKRCFLPFSCLSPTELLDSLHLFASSHRARASLLKKVSLGWLGHRQPDAEGHHHTYGAWGAEFTIKLLIMSKFLTNRHTIMSSIFHHQIQILKFRSKLQSGPISGCYNYAECGGHFRVSHEHCRIRFSIWEIATLKVLSWFHYHYQHPLLYGVQVLQRKTARWARTGQAWEFCERLVYCIISQKGSYQTDSICLIILGLCMSNQCPRMQTDSLSTEEFYLSCSIASTSGWHIWVAGWLGKCWYRGIASWSGCGICLLRWLHSISPSSSTFSWSHFSAWTDLRNLRHTSTSFNCFCLIQRSIFTSWTEHNPHKASHDHMEMSKLRERHCQLEKFPSQHWRKRDLNHGLLLAPHIGDLGSNIIHIPVLHLQLWIRSTGNVPSCF